jgi:ABC-type phosphate transport system auxiliary subunit
MNDESTQDLSSNETLKNLVALIQGMGSQLSALQVKVDERLYDTRPLWESVQSQINDLSAEMEQGFRQVRAEMEQGFRQLRTEMAGALQELRAASNADIEKLNTELSRELRHVSNSLDALHGKMLRYDTIQRDIENRVRDIESKAL